MWNYWLDHMWQTFLFSLSGGGRNHSCGSTLLVGFRLNSCTFDDALDFY